MKKPLEESIVQLEHELDRAARTLSSVQSLNARQAARVGERMDRLASQLIERALRSSAH